MPTPKNRILLVEDDADDRHIMEQAFQELACDGNIKMFRSGPELLDYLRPLALPALPELIVLDYNMPSLNGAELALQLKAQENLKNVRIVLYSTGMSPRMKEELLEAGILHCFDKGMDYREILDLVQRLLLLSGQPAKTAAEGSLA